VPFSHLSGADLSRHCNILSSALKDILSICKAQGIDANNIINKAYTLYNTYVETNLGDKFLTLSTLSPIQEQKILLPHVYLG